MQPSTEDLVAAFLTRGGSVKTLPEATQKGRVGRIVSIVEFPPFKKYANIGAFRLKIVFNDRNGPVDVAASREFAEGLVEGGIYAFQTTLNSFVGRERGKNSPENSTPLRITQKPVLQMETGITPKNI